MMPRFPRAAVGALPRAGHQTVRAGSAPGTRSPAECNSDAGGIPRLTRGPGDRRDPPTCRPPPSTARGRGHRGRAASSSPASRAGAEAEAAGPRRPPPPARAAPRAPRRAHLTATRTELSSGAPHMLAGRRRGLGRQGGRLTSAALQPCWRLTGRGRRAAAGARPGRVGGARDRGPALRRPRAAWRPLGDAAGAPPPASPRPPRPGPAAAPPACALSRAAGRGFVARGAARARAEAAECGCARPARAGTERPPGTARSCAATEACRGGRPDTPTFFPRGLQRAPPAPGLSSTDPLWLLLVAMALAHALGQLCGDSLCQLCRTVSFGDGLCISLNKHVRSCSAVWRWVKQRRPGRQGPSACSPKPHSDHPDPQKCSSAAQRRQHTLGRIGVQWS